MTSSKPNYLLSVLLPNTITWGVRASACEFAGGDIIWFIAHFEVVFNLHYYNNAVINIIGHIAL